MSYAAPNILNYYIGKGVVSFLKDGELVWRELGNVPEFEWTPQVEKLEHFSSQSGVKTKDRTVVLQKSATVKITLEEWNVDNMAIALLGDVSVDSNGRQVIDIFSENSISGQLKFHSTNEVGPRYEYHLLKVEFIPGEALNPISDEWGQLVLTGDVSAVAGSFGTCTHIGEEDSES